MPAQHAAALLAHQTPRPQVRKGRKGRKLRLEVFGARERWWDFSHEPAIVALQGTPVNRPRKFGCENSRRPARHVSETLGPAHGLLPSGTRRSESRAPRLREAFPDICRAPACPVIWRDAAR